MNNWKWIAGSGKCGSSNNIGETVAQQIIICVHVNRVEFVCLLDTELLGRKLKPGERMRDRLARKQQSIFHRKWRDKDSQNRKKWGNSVFIALQKLRKRIFNLTFRCMAMVPCNAESNMLIPQNIRPHNSNWFEIIAHLPRFSFLHNIYESSNYFAPSVHEYSLCRWLNF